MSRTKTNILSLRMILLEAAVLLLIAYAAGFIKYQVRLGRDFLGSDSFMHVVRLQNIAAKGSLHATTFERLNAPYGADLHWTMPFDALALALAAPFSWFLGWQKAIIWIAPLLGPLLHLLVLAASLWALSRFLDRWTLRLAVFMLAVSPLALNYGLYGTVDHHLLILASWIYFAGWLARSLLRDAPPNAPLMLAVSAALCLWISPESYPGIIFGIGILAVSWAWRLLPKDKDIQTFARAFPALLLVFLWVDPPRSGMMHVDYGRLSAITLVFGVLAGLAFGGMLVYPARKRSRRKTRLVLATAYLGLAAAAFLVLFPEYLTLRGPYDINAWLTAHIEEFVSPLEMPLPLLLISAARPVAGLGALLFFLYSEKMKKTRGLWAALTILHVIYFLWGMHQWRFLFYSDTISVFVLAWLARELLKRWENRKPVLPFLQTRSLVFLIFLAGPFVPAGLTAVLKAPDPAASGAGQNAGCRLDPLAAVMNDAAFIPERSAVIAAEIGNAGEILFRTPHQVLAGPYGELTGPRDLMNFLYDYPESKARTVAEKRKIDYVLVCRTRVESFRLPHPDSIFRRILEEDPPSFLEKVAWPEGLATDFVLYRVRRKE